MSVVNTVSDIFADMVSGTVGPIAAAGASLAEQAFTDNSMEELKANNQKYNDAMNYAPRTEGGTAFNKGAMEAIGEGVAAVGEFYTEHEDSVPQIAKDAVGATVDTWNDLDESTRFALGNVATVGEVLPIGKVASLAKRASKVEAPSVDGDELYRNILGETLEEPVPWKPKETPQLAAAATPQTPNVDAIGYTSGIEEGIIRLINDGKVPDTVNASQLMGLLKKGGGVKADEIEWTTFKDYIDSLGKEKIPLEEALRQARDRSISLEVIEVPEGEFKFSDYSPNGGTNYKELLFKFDTTKELTEGRKPSREKADALRLELINLKEQRKELIDSRSAQMAANLPDIDLSNQWLSSQGASTARTAALKQAAMDELPTSSRQADVEYELAENLKKARATRDKIESATFLKGHWQGKPNILFHARVTDREIAGGKSLGIDEIQSDWHQGTNGLIDKPYYRLSEAKLPIFINDQYEQATKTYDGLSKKVGKAQANRASILKESGEPSHVLYGGDGADSDNYKKAVRAEQDLVNKLQEAEELIITHRSAKAELEREGYSRFTRGLKPNAPLKNKDKWMASAINSLLYKAVKEGYDSVSWPNGKTQSTLYDPHLKPSQVEALEKMYDVTVPNMLRKMAQDLDPDAVLVRGKHSSESKPHPQKNPDNNGDTEWEDRLNGGFVEDGDLYDEFGDLAERGVNREDFNAEYGFVEPDVTDGTFDEVNSAYSHIKITPTMKQAILKGKPLFLAEGGFVSGSVDIASDLISGTIGPIGAAAVSLAEQTFTDNTVEEMKANNDKYNDFLNYQPRTQMGKAANEGFLETMGDGVTAAVDYYKENEDNVPDAVKNTVSSVVNTWNDLDESTRFALGNIATVGEVLPVGKAASLVKKGISNASDTRKINRAASQVPDESAYFPVQDRLADMGARQEMSYIKGQEGSATTQVATTIGSYKKAVKKAEELNPKGKTVLDYGAGLGLGTDAMRSTSKLEVTSYEPFPERWKGDSPVDYTDSSLITEQYDSVVNLNVLNVLEPELRSVVAKDLMSKVKAGGIAIIGTRGWKGDIDATKKFKPTDEPQAIWVKKSSGDVYQKGFDGDELKDYIADLAPEGFRVERGKSIGNNTVYVFNDNKITPSKIDKEMGEIVGFEDGVAGLTRQQTMQALEDQFYRRLTPVGDIDHKETGSHTYRDGTFEGYYPQRMTEATRKNRMKTYVKNLKNPAVFRREAYTLDKRIQQTQLTERRVIHPEELLGKVGVPVVGDRSIRITGPDKDSRAIVDINGVPLDSKHIPEGGMEYSRDHGGWASMSAAAKKKITNFALAADETGIEDVLGIYSAMGRESINFSADTLVPMIKQLKAIGIDPADIKAFDDAIRKGRTTINRKTGETTTTALPKWKGLEHPDVMKQLLGVEGDVDFPRDGAGALRKVVLKEMVRPEWFAKGFPNYNDVVETMTVPDLSDFKEGASGLTMFKPEFKKGRGEDGKLIESSKNSSATKSDHVSYGTHIPGEYFGGLFASVPPHIMYPDTFKALSLRNDRSGKPMSFANQVGSLTQNPKLYEVYTPEKIDNIIKYLNATHGTDYNEGGLVEGEVPIHSIFDDMVS